MTIDKYQFTVKQHTLGNIYIILIINHSTFNFSTHFPFFQLFFDGSKASNHCQLLIVIGQLFLLVEIHKKIEDLNVTLLGLDTEKLGALEKIGGKLSLNCTAEYLKLPAGLKNLKVFVVSKGIERLDIQGIEIEELRFSGTGLENTTVIGDDIFKGKISLDNLSGYFPKLEGFREVGKLNIGYLGLNGGSIEIGNIRKINGDFSYWANSNVKAVEFPALEEVTGNFELYSNIKEYHFPELKSIGGKAIISIDYYDEKTFPNLATVGEDMMFQTGYDYYGSRDRPWSCIRL